jgi:hypothetical protein
MLFPLRGGEATRIPMSESGISVRGWTSDGAHLYVSLPSRVSSAEIVPSGPRRVGILDVKTGQIAPWRTLGSEDGASSIHVTPDGRAYVYSFVHSQGDLYLIEGLK